MDVAFKLRMCVFADATLNAMCNRKANQVEVLVCLYAITQAEEVTTPTDLKHRCMERV